MKETKLCVMEGVREHTEKDPVELWIADNGRLVIRAYNECGNNVTEVDLEDVASWLARNRDQLRNHSPSDSA